MRPWRRAVAIRTNARREIKKLLATLGDRRGAAARPARFSLLTEAEAAAILGGEWLARLRTTCGGRTGA
jgi:hypothetical protein